MTEKKVNKLEVEGTAMYASVHKPKKAYNPGDPPIWSLDLIVDQETEKTLKAAGLTHSKVKVDEDTMKAKEYASHPGQKVYSFKKKSSYTDAEGNEVKSKPVVVVDSAGNTIPESILIGNGSKVSVSIWPTTFKNKTGKSITTARLIGVQVLDLVPYESTPMFKKREGFTVQASQTAQGSSGREDLNTDDDSPPFEDE